jgi:hypothetical protein
MHMGGRDHVAIECHGHAQDPRETRAYVPDGDL